MRTFIFLVIFLFYCLPTSAAQLSDYEKVKCIIHLHTDISKDGRQLESYIREAKEKGIGAIVVTDEDWQRWEYGVPPFRKLIKKVIKKKSVMTYGIENYLNLIKSINQKYKDVIIIDGVQTNPFYYWSGNFFKGSLTLNNRNKDMLVIGLGNADYYKNMPSIVTYNSRFDAYHGDKFTEPYQDLIDYVVKKEGLIFWSHPEYEENTVKYGVRLLTVPYHWDLIGTYNYTGFGVFWAGYNKTGNPMGLWDRILTEYCEEKRKSPVWAIGELEEEGLGDKDLDNVFNAIYVKNLSREEILEALKRGRSYVVLKPRGKISLALEEFQISDESGKKSLTMGEEASFSGVPIIKIRISHERPTDNGITIRLLRNNKIIEEFIGESQTEIEYKDEGLLSNQKYYYRIDARSHGGGRLISNPIFFRKIKHEDIRNSADL